MDPARAGYLPETVGRLQARICILFDPRRQEFRKPGLIGSLEPVILFPGGCQKPENLKDKPEDCSPEQIRECHGEAKQHPCTTSKGK